MEGYRRRAHHSNARGQVTAESSRQIIMGMLALVFVGVAPTESLWGERLKESGGEMMEFQERKQSWQ